MSLRAELPVKLYYRIGEVAEIVGVEPHVLRYWESEFGAIRPQKSPKGQRVYSRRDLEKLLRVKELLYDEGYTIAGAKKRLRDLSPSPPTGAPATMAEPAADAGCSDVVDAGAPQDLGAAEQAERYRLELLEIRDVLRAELEALDGAALDRGPFESV